MNNRDTDTKEQIISYQQLRTFIGMIGLFLPFVLVAGCYVHGDGEYSWQPSISHYYYTEMHIVFVCSLCVLGGFLITYKGRKADVWESRVSNLAGYLALGVASFPTRFQYFRLSPGNINLYLQLGKEITPGWDDVHLACASLLFVCFVIFCLWFFQKPDGLYLTPEEKTKFRRRKRFYAWCGWGIIVGIAAIALFKILNYRQGLLSFTIFFFETTSLWFFGAAWLVKGSLFWKHYPILRNLIKPLR